MSWFGSRYIWYMIPTYFLRLSRNRSGRAGGAAGQGRPGWDGELFWSVPFVARLLTWTFLILVTVALLATFRRFEISRNTQQVLHQSKQKWTDVNLTQKSYSLRRSWSFRSQLHEPVWRKQIWATCQIASCRLRARVDVRYLSSLASGVILDRSLWTTSLRTQNV